MREEVREIKEIRENKITNWEERIEHKLNMLFDEMLDLREQFEYIRDELFKDKLKKETKELEYQLEDKKGIIRNIENNSYRYYETRCAKRDRFDGIR